MKRLQRHLACLLLLFGIAVAVGSGRAQPGASASGSPKTSATSETVVQQLVQEVLRNNLSLKQERISLKQRRSALAQTKGRYLPSLDLKARYTRSRGGRTIDFPVGDAVNPAYRALDQMNPNRQFPRLQNREISLMREKEQRTELQLHQPIYQPKIWRAAEARKHEVRSQEASVEAERRRLAREVKTAYYRYRKAQARVEILEATQRRAREAQRTNKRLLAAEKVTQDAVHRAETEVLAVRQKLTEALASVRQARRQLNVLRNCPEDAGIPAPQADVETRIEQRVNRIEQRLARDLFETEALADVGSGAGIKPNSGPNFASTLATVSPSPKTDSDDRAHPLVGDRPALKRLDAAAKAAEAQRRAAQTDFFPTVSLGVDAGIQGETYGFSGDKPFARASLVLEWSLFDGLTDHRRVQRHRLETKRLRARRQHVERQLTQAMRTALEEVRVARRSLQTAEARVTAARESFRLTQRRHEAGRANQATLIGARTALTKAELNLSVTRYDLLIRLTELEYAAGLPPTFSE
jgi:outer membrane protein TolC